MIRAQFLYRTQQLVRISGFLPAAKGTERNYSKEVCRHTEKRVITQAEVDEFTKISGDTNFIHSAECPSEKRCIHGAFLNAIVAGIIGTKLPGEGSIVLNQEFGFPHKCVTDEEITIVVRLLDDRHIKKIAYEAKQMDRCVFSGQANIVVRKN